MGEAVRNSTAAIRYLHKPQYFNKLESHVLEIVYFQLHKVKSFTTHNDLRSVRSQCKERGVEPRKMAGEWQLVQKFKRGEPNIEKEYLEIEDAENDIDWYSFQEFEQEWKRRGSILAVDYKNAKFTEKDIYVSKRMVVKSLGIARRAPPSTPKTFQLFGD